MITISLLHDQIFWRKTNEILKNKSDFVSDHFIDTDFGMCWIDIFLPLLLTLLHFYQLKFKMKITFFMSTCLQRSKTPV